MQCRVYSEDGRNLEFGHIVRGNWGAPTIVIFVRHMWCGLCQEFLRSLRRVDEKCYKSAGVEIIVVGCGDPSLIRRYKGACAAFRLTDKDRADCSTGIRRDRKIRRAHVQ